MNKSIWLRPAALARGLRRANEAVFSDTAVVGAACHTQARSPSGRRWIDSQPLRTALVLGLLALAALAHEIRPALLEMRERKPGVFDVVWKVPARGDMVLPLRPIFPKRMKLQAQPIVDRPPGAIIERCTFVNEGAPLDGSIVTIEGLAKTQVDTLVRLTLLDGRTRTTIVRPSSPIYRFPRPDFQPTDVVVWENVKRGFFDLLPGIGNLLLVLVLVLMGRPSLLLALVGGHGAAMMVAELGVTSFYPAVGEIVVALAVVFGARAIVLKRALPMALPVFVAGLCYGLGQATELLAAGLAEPNLLHGMFGSMVGLDAGLAGIALVLFPIARWLPGRAFAYAAGVGAVAWGIAEFQEQPPVPEAAPPEASVKPPSAPPNVARPTPELGEPVTAFLTILANEVRLEVLVRAQILDDIDGPVIAPEAQAEIIAKLLKQRCAVTIDRKPAQPIIERGEFVMLGSYGILTRTEPVPEPIERALIGLTVVYACDGMPSDVALDWALPYEATVTISEPGGGSQKKLSPTDRSLDWQASVYSFDIKTLKPVLVESVQVPVASLALALVGFFLLRRRRGLATVCLLAAISVYPFVRMPIGMSKTPTQREAGAIVNRLLANVYRSFDLREERAVYDRLERTVLGEQLTEIYLQSRRTLELEERGGARGRVDAVDVDRVRSVTRNDDGSYSVEADWIVGGSVSHFGHTHYRQNRYRAIVRIIPDGDTWRIQGLDVVEERRLL